MTVLEDYKNYKRDFIQISPRTAILLHIFSKENDDIEDIILLDNEAFADNARSLKIYENAAEQFFKQFEGKACLYFFRCLRDKCNKLLEEHEQKVKEFEKLKDKTNESNSN